MRRGREARLRRFMTGVDAAERALAEHRRALRSRAAIGEAVRWSLAQFGVDPARAVMLRAAEEAASELAALPDTKELRRASGQAPRQQGGVPPDDDLWLDEDTGRLVERFRNGKFPEPDLARASLAELFAWCIARHAGASHTSGLDQ